MVLYLIRRWWQHFLQLNLYKKASSDIHTASKERFATRLYIGSLAVTFLIITIVAASLVRTVNKTEYSPSQTRFSYLANKYPATIYCPCSTIGIAYHTFVAIHARFHQVCTSQFVQQAWIDIVFAHGNNASLSPDDFRATVSFFWQAIAGLCNISNATWSNIVAGFSASHNFNPVAVTEQIIQAQVGTTLDNSIYLARATLNRNLLAIRRMMSGNQIVSALATNFYLRYTPNNSNPNRSPKMSPRTYDNCSCLHSQGCPHPATITDRDGNLVTLQGIVADCYMMDGTLASTLECYYSQSCLSLLHPYLPAFILPMSNALNKHFTINSTVAMLLNESMIDEITSDLRFDLFYSQCNPDYCSYAYTHRFDVLFVATTIFGIFGGVSSVLRLIAPIVIAIILRWINRRAPRNNSSHVTIPEQGRCK